MILLQMLYFSVTRELICISLVTGHGNVPSVLIYKLWDSFPLLPVLQWEQNTLIDPIRNSNFRTLNFKW